MAEATHRAEVVPVVMEKHPDADSLSIVKVWNFTCVVRTADWVGVDRAVYVQPDSVLPDKPEYRFLKETPSTRKEQEAIRANAELTEEQKAALLAEVEAKIDRNTKYLRLTAKKLRGYWSMGMLLPIPADLNPAAIEIGDDLAEVMGITHYDAPEEPEQGPAKPKGMYVGPPPPIPLAPKYDVESAYRYAAEAFEPGEMVYVSEKLDGQNARFVAVDEASGICHCGEAMEGHTVYGNHQPTDNPYPKQFAGSRKEWLIEDGGTNWWMVQKQNPWIPQWCRENRDKLLYGENFGWVQALRYGATLPGQLFFRAFDILDVTRYIDAEEFIKALPEDHRVPSFGIMPYDFDTMVKLAEGKTLIPGANHMREGIVIKPIRERYHRKLGRVMVKFVSLAYLAEQGKR